MEKEIRVISNGEWLNNMRDKSESKEEVLKRYKQDTKSTAKVCFVCGFIIALYLGAAATMITLKILEGGI